MDIHTYVAINYHWLISEHNVALVNTREPEIVMHIYSILNPYIMGVNLN